MRSEMSFICCFDTESSLSDSNWNTAQFQISRVGLGFPSPPSLPSPQVDLGLLPDPALLGVALGLGFPS